VIVSPAAVKSGATVERLEVSAYEVPTDGPESDGTLEWDSTTLVLVEVEAEGSRGLGYTYDDLAAAQLIESKLAPVVQGCDALSPPAAWTAMQKSVRNVGRPGIAAAAISAVDVALWDLKARLLGVPLAASLPRFRDSIPIYGSGGFTSYSNERLREQLAGWAADGIPRVKMKVGREPDADLERVRAARRAVGDEVELMVDANGAFKAKQALSWAERFARLGVRYFEEPVSSDDLEGLRFVRERAPAGMSIAAGEYGWDLPYFRAMLEAGAVDVLQADVTRCGGITNLLRIDGLCKARNTPFSAHCAPAISAHSCCAMETVIHLEYFHDHVRIEGLLFEGTLEPQGGLLVPDPDRPGLGLELNHEQAAPYQVHGDGR
jgi:L-alanine-DL-glutamate epimerase-like enolase superfamily enzyme